MVNRTRSNGCTTIDVKSVCRNIGSARPCFEFRVTSAKSSRLWTPFKQWHGRGIGNDLFFSWPAIIRRESSTLIVTIKCTSIHGVAQSEVHQGSAGSDREFL